MSKKNKKKNKNPIYQTSRYLTADERPLFIACNAVHKTAKDKANKRSEKKLEIKKILSEID